MQFAVITFPGSNCDRDMVTALESVTGRVCHRIWHNDTQIPSNLDLIVLPGGFSFGDYLRSGAISARSPIMREVAAAAKRGVYLLGVCNGFQILTESGLLPGFLNRNQHLHFICKTVALKIHNYQTAFTHSYPQDHIVHMPVAHHDGNYYADEATLKALEDHGQIVFTYHEENPNGSCCHIAGITDKKQRILGMMPHPERACDHQTAGTDGVALFKSLLQSLS